MKKIARAFALIVGIPASLLILGDDRGLIAAGIILIIIFIKDDAIG